MESPSRRKIKLRKKERRKEKTGREGKIKKIREKKTGRKEEITGDDTLFSGI